MLKLRGGYDVALAGRPANRIDRLSDPALLCLPLHTRRLHFTEPRVEEGATVAAGAVLATDPANHGVPLLAPRAGTVRWAHTPGHAVLEDLAPGEEAVTPAEEPDTRDEGGEIGRRCRRLHRLGVWPFLEDAHTGRVPECGVTPRAILISTARLEPFLARGNVVLNDLRVFARGLEHLQSLLEYQPMYLVMPEVNSPLAMAVRDMVRGKAWLKLVTISLTYPHDHPAVIARGLGLMRAGEGPVWAIHADGVLAIEQALSRGQAATSRTISVGGPGAKTPRHFEVPLGYPLEEIARAEAVPGPVRIIHGGALTGRAADEDTRGVDAECAGVTLVPEPGERELLGWLRPGWSRRSYSRCFASSLHRTRPQRLTTAVRGERRACVACGQCESVCPAGLLPHVLHRYLYAGAIDDAERLRLDLCIGCGLCAVVCPSKIDLLGQFLEAQETLRSEHEQAQEALG